MPEKQDEPVEVGARRLAAIFVYVEVHVPGDRQASFAFAGRLVVARNRHRLQRARRRLRGRRRDRCAGHRLSLWEWRGARSVRQQLIDSLLQRTETRIDAIGDRDRKARVQLSKLAFEIGESPFPVSIRLSRGRN